MEDGGVHPLQDVQVLEQLEDEFKNSGKYSEMQLKKLENKFQ